MKSALHQFFIPGKGWS